MPTFLFVDDGRVVTRVTGWPGAPGGNRQSLLDAARRLGLLPAE